MDVRDHITNLLGRKGNCWLLVRDWIKANGHRRFVAEVEDYAARHSWAKADADLLNPIWLSSKFDMREGSPQPGDLAVVRAGQGWGFGLVADEGNVMLVLEGRFELRPLADIGADSTFLRVR